MYRTVVTEKRPTSFKWTTTAIAAIAMALFLTRGGMATVGPLLRLALPVVLVVIAYRAVKGRIRSAVEEALRVQQRGRPPYQESQAAQGGEVIDLCPRCGAYQKPGHRCS